MVMMATEYKVLDIPECRYLLTYLLEIVLFGAKSITVELMHTSLSIKQLSRLISSGATGSQAITVLLSILLMLYIDILTLVCCFKLK